MIESQRSTPRAYRRDLLRARQVVAQLREQASGGESETGEDHLRNLPRGHVTVAPGLADQPLESP